MTVDLGSPLGHAGLHTLASTDVLARSLIPGRSPQLLSLTWPLPYTFPRPSQTNNTALFRGLYSSACLLLVRMFSPRVLTVSFCHLLACLLVFAERISSTLKMEAICSSETSRKRLKLHGLHSIISQKMILFENMIISNNTHTTKALQNKTCSTDSVCEDELQKVLQNLFMCYKACLKADGIISSSSY
jgi:hypothetical protein